LFLREKPAQRLPKNSILQAESLYLREALFIKKNKDRWLENQQDPPDDADEMASHFSQLVDDLAYAKTFYPTSKVTRYINSEASKIYLSIYRNRREETNRLVHFWKYDLPLTIRKHHRVILFTFILFVAFWVIGYFVSKDDPALTSSIFSEGYLEETEKNIRNKNPFGIYENGNPFFTWIWIMFSNIRVAFLIFVSGIFCTLPSLYLMGQNSIMVGIFDQIFASHGLGLDFFLVVFVHGTLEMTAFIIASAAGIVLGKSFLFPGTVRRIDAFKRGAKDGVKLMVGIVPVLAVAAFFEGFITRLYNDISILTTIVFSLSIVFVIWYFIIYPIRLARRTALRLNEEEV